MKSVFQPALTALLLTVSAGVSAQDVWSLERCILQAQDANFTVQQARANIKVAVLAEKQAKAARLPDVSINSNLGEQFGRTIDPTTNGFVTTGIGYNSMSLSAGVPLYSGGQILHTIKQARFDTQAAEADAEQTTNNLALMVAQAYLSILLAEEQAQSAGRRVEQSQRQMNATQKLIDAGTVPLAEKFNVQAQIAREEQAAVTARNTVELAYLNLKQLLQLEPDFDLRIERPAFEIPADANPESYALPTVYATALQAQPNVRAAGMRIKSAEEAVPLAKSAYFPTVSLAVSLSSSYSSQSLDYTQGKYLGTLLTPPVKQRVDGVDQMVQRYIDAYDFPKTPYFTQLDQNFGQGIFMQIRIPIYQNGRVRLNVERARLGLVTAQLQQNQTQQQLKNDIQTAIANARAARKQLDAAQKSFEAMQAAFSNTEKRHSLGAVNTLELTTAKTNFDNAENDLIVARYDYLFKLKILDFYEGKALRLK